MMFCDSGPPRNANLRSHHVQTPGIPVPGEQDTEQDTHAAGSNGRVLRVRHDIMPGPSWAKVGCIQVSQSVSLHKVKANLPENIACLGHGHGYTASINHHQSSIRLQGYLSEILLDFGDIHVSKW